MQFSFASPAGALIGLAVLLPLAALAESRWLRAGTLALCAFIVVTRVPLLGG